MQCMQATILSGSVSSQRMVTAVMLVAKSHCRQTKIAEGLPGQKMGVSAAEIDETPQ